MEDQNSGAPDGATQPTTDAVAKPGPDHLKLAIADRDKHKAKARAAEAELAAARVRLQELEGMRVEIETARLESLLAELVPAAQHKAAKAVLQAEGIDVMHTSANDVRFALHAAGLGLPTGGPYAGSPGVNFNAKPPGERPDVHATREEEERARVAALARKHSVGPSNPNENVTYSKFGRPAVAKESPATSFERVKAIAARLSQQAAGSNPDGRPMSIDAAEFAKK